MRELRAKRRIITTSRSLFLTPELPFHINRVSESFQLEEHRHEFFEINYVSEGSGYQHIEGRTLSVAKGDLFVIPPGASHVFRPRTSAREGGRLIVYNCLFNEWLVEKLTAAVPMEPGLMKLLTAGYPEQPWLYLRDRGDMFQHAFNRMHEEFRLRKPHYAAMVQADIIRLLVQVQRRLEPEGADWEEWPESFQAAAPAERGQDVERLLGRIAERIRRHPESPVHVRELADEARLGERQFRRRFIARTGMTLTEYVHKYRIEASCDRLLFTRDSIAVIAQQAGYQDLKFFNRLFKKKTGMTPGQYRKSGGASPVIAEPADPELAEGE
ncbi:AraC-type DNA-binding protein [Paenibacillus sp. UNCCL117]|uniref:AraC family transcriptional regulator n=1 Tax=unclassified Paenibacillus TaxID=185978 RepID=UPI00088B3D0F|nr:MULTISPECIES: AraC family transcriptional regulator [unclassified Paenibacillus]SDD70583.1 AraC-type DNA-binding protein [Paenibacillus sp. cl123]SFW45372.1 AraC-type DNA-binding protein [Paenibacillus sp. UNCCL117]